MYHRRKGSVLFTAVSMVAVFLTLVVASTAYVQSSTTASMNDRFRDTAEQAARSGLEWVMGYAQQNIDAESRLPREWGRMSDGDIFNPVPNYLNPRGAASQNLVNAALLPGTMLGVAAAGVAPTPTFPAGVGEYVLSKQGNYYVTFKARIQQYSFAESMPRQYRVGIIGRVRKASTRAAANDVNADERGTIVAESLIVSNVGQVPTSRYAALIDIDGVKNWVPGEVVNGPVHINRGYIDSVTETTSGLTGGPQYRNEGVLNTYTGSIPFVYTGIPANAGSNNTRDIRSTMNLRTAPGNPFGTLGSPFQPVYDAEYGTTLYAPRFNDEVTMTAVIAGDPTAQTYKNLDPVSATLGLCAGSNTTGVGVLIDGQAYNVTSAGTSPAAIFQAPENAKGDGVHFGTPSVTNGPTILKQPIALPRSVRNRLHSVVGAPGSLTSFPWWDGIDDGVYVPTTAFWTAPGSPTPYSGTANAYTENNATGNASGGIYIRGNVEVMRMGVEGVYSYYLFQLGFGGPPSVPNLNSRRSYAVIANRATNDMWLCAWPAATSIPGLSAGAGNGTSLTTILGGGALVPGAGVTGFANTQTPGSFGLHQAVPGKISAYFPPSAGGQSFPFNGVIFVDISAYDWARQIGNPNKYNKFPPITGNIFALGDPGTALGNPQTKRTLSGNVEERVATYTGTVTSSQASSLTIMATGNIFIQNDIALNALATVPGVTTFPGFSFADSQRITVQNTRDLLGIVADKQIVLGLGAPSTATRANKGVAIHAAIAALGDPGYDFVSEQANPTFMTGNNAYRGSFATEGLMQYYNLAEDYQVCDGGPNIIYAPFPLVYPFGGAGAPTKGSLAAPPLLALGTIGCSQTLIGEAPSANGYPGDPIYGTTGFAFSPPLTNFLNDPNGIATRGRAIVFGSVTVKKRGILGKGDTSYDKRFLFDRRLLTIAPPIFPSSTDVIVRTSNPVQPQLLHYAGGPPVMTPASLDFMKTLP